MRGSGDQGSVGSDYASEEGLGGAGSVGGGSGGTTVQQVEEAHEEKLFRQGLLQLRMSTRNTRILVWPYSYET